MDGRRAYPGEKEKGKRREKEEEKENNENGNGTKDIDSGGEREERDEGTGRETIILSNNNLTRREIRVADTEQHETKQNKQKIEQKYRGLAGEGKKGVDGN